jgi:hypothetical protein
MALFIVAEFDALLDVVGLADVETSTKVKRKIWFASLVSSRVLRLGQEGEVARLPAVLPVFWCPLGFFEESGS